MKHVNPPPSRSILALASIWTLNHHDFLAGRIQSYVWAASATVLFFSVAGILSLRTALYVILVGGIGMLVLLGSLIHWRKAILLDIRDETLKQAAHAAHARPDPCPAGKIRGPGKS